MHYYRCDCCGKELDLKKLWVLNLIPEDPCKPNQRWDLCSACITGVRGFLNSKRHDNGQDESGER